MKADACQGERKAGNKHEREPDDRGQREVGSAAVGPGALGDDLVGRRVDDGGSVPDL